jgi:hypothetical protein
VEEKGLLYDMLHCLIQTWTNQQNGNVWEEGGGKECPSPLHSSLSLATIIIASVGFIVFPTVAVFRLAPYFQLHFLM